MVFESWTATEIPDMQGKVVIVTGGYSGMSFEVAKRLASNNAHVILAGRNKQRGNRAIDILRLAAPQGRYEFMECDFESLRSVKAFAERFLATGLPLHVLINFAGTFVPPHDSTQEGFEVQLGINYYGHMLLTQYLLGALRDSAPSRVVFMGSAAEFWGNIDWSDLRGTKWNISGLTMYGRANLWKLMMVREMARRLDGSGVCVLGVQPGLVYTPLVRKMDPLKPTSIAINILGRVMGQSLERGALSTLYAATAPRLNGVTGKIFGPKIGPHLGPLQINNAGAWEPFNRLARDAPAQARLYNETVRILEEVTGEQVPHKLHPAGGKQAEARMNGHRRHAAMGNGRVMQHSIGFNTGDI